MSSASKSRQRNATSPEVQSTEPAESHSPSHGADEALAPTPSVTQDASAGSRPPLHTLLNLTDFEAVARAHFPAKAFAFYSSAATDLTTYHLNRALYQRIFLRPRILRAIRHVSLATSALQHPLALPLFIAPAAMAGLAHPLGELALARAAARTGIAHVVSSHASFRLEDIARACAPGPAPVLFFQLYVDTNRANTEALLARVAARPEVKAIFLTVDAPVAGKREADERVASAGAERSGLSGARTGAAADKNGGGLGRLMGSYIEQDLTWEDLPWIRRASGGLPLVLKGVQTPADARRAVEAGVQGIVVSNHGGRTIDTAQPALLNLLEIRRNAPEVFEKLEVFVDGGVRRGTDVLKALALGARAVGLGRPFLYSLAYGQEGTEHMVNRKSSKHGSRCHANERQSSRMSSRRR